LIFDCIFFYFYSGDFEFDNFDQKRTSKEEEETIQLSLSVFFYHLISMIG